MTTAPLWDRGEARRGKSGAAGKSGRGGRGRRGEQTMVPDATFSSYYGRPILKPPVWSELDIAGYLFTGGLAAGSAMLAAGADLAGLDALRRHGRLTAIAAVAVSTVALVHDLGRRWRFVNMLRVLKVTSPMSVGSWLLSGFATVSGLAAAAELPVLLPAPLRPLVRVLARPAGLAAAALAPGLATYTAVLIADTAVPTWHEAHRELPLLFSGSAAAASGGLALLTCPVAGATPARRFAVAGAVLDLVTSQVMEHRLGLSGETLSHGKAGRRLRAAKALTATGAVGVAVAGHRSRVAAAAFGAALVAGSALTRFGIFEAGVASTRDPKYVVIPQRERLAAREAAAAGAVAPERVSAAGS